MREGRKHREEAKVKKGRQREEDSVGGFEHKGEREEDYEMFARL